jgi:RNA polymerase sigma-70 factor (ECF subfamily)
VSRNLAPDDFEAMVEAHRGEIFAYLWRLLGDDRADDVLQESFLRAWRAFPRLPAGANRRAWLYRIAGNTAFTHLRRARREDDRQAALDPDLAAGGPGPDDAFENRQRLTALRSAVRALPPRQQSALLLRKYQGLSYAAIARTLGCSPQAARASVYQALRRLRTRFAQPQPESER